MAIDYSIDTQRNLVITTLSGVLNFEECVAHHIKLGSDKDFDPSGCELIDGSALKSVALASTSIFSLSKTCPFGSSARRAIYASDNTFHYGLARMFQMVTGEKHGEIMVFKDRDEAVAWLNIE
ncbi:hypothetical protein MMIC_P1364 [Mariprofundus micogutta]|uniref:STAS/SEC14 domain-containing protein n=1 Tax=Mariprofundus micogutta TaxID=1921010 RepID=A0A1L8CNJ1_9PROT|nr:hypothetical protein [Mariprofundus micogutta]GAV20399.1 hypothetical protein MMIC_P1364 [Mariprofundus micogutta]